MKKAKKIVAASEPPKNLPDGRVDDVFPVNKLTHAPWNPRTPEELKPDHPEMVKLVESVRALGVVQPVAVWDSDDEFMYCIAGNRRLEAAKIVGLKFVPAIVYTDIDEATARAITRAENEVRFGVSPLLDAKLIGDLKDQGRSQAEIAAIFGTSEAKICRRAKLLDLSPETIKFFEGREYEVAALEFLADKSLGDAKRQADMLRGLYRSTVTLTDIRFAYNTVTSLLNFNSYVYTCPGGEARKAKCVSCALCTGNQPDLFGETDGKKENRCLDPKCYRRFVVEADADILTAALEAGGGCAADAKRLTRLRSSEFADRTKGMKRKKSGKAEFPYGTYEQYDHTWIVKWGPDPKAAAKAEKEKKAAEKAERAEERKISETADAAIERVIKWFLTPVEGEYDNGNYCAQILRRLESLKGVGGEELCRNALLSMLSKALALSDIESEYRNEPLRRALVDWLNLHHCVPADIDLTPEEQHAISATAPED